MLTTCCEARFTVYTGAVFLDEQEFPISVLGGRQLQEILLGVRWLETKRLVADFPARVLTLG